MDRKLATGICFLSLILIFAAFVNTAVSSDNCPVCRECGLYHEYDCMGSFSACRAGCADYSLCHETDINRLYREYVQELEREKSNNPWHWF